MQKKRASWDKYTDLLNEHFLDDLVFIDESGVNINMVRRYGRAPGDERVIDSAPVNTPATTTVIAGITIAGPIAAATWQGGTTKTRFLAWLKDNLIPALRPGQILIMDNLTAHHSKEVTALLKASRVPVLYLPPYSPDTNPIEMMWSKMKEALRKLRIRLAEDLPEAVRKFLDQGVTAGNCIGWFRKDGYAPPSAA